MNVQVLSNALSLFTNAIQAAATNTSSVNVSVPQGQTSTQTNVATPSGSATNM